MKRAPGTGSVTPLKNPDGSVRGYWARLWVDGKKKSLGVHPTPEVAAAVLDETIHARGLRAGAGGSKLTFADFARDVLETRELDGLRSVYSEKNRFDVHLAECDIADKALDEITSADIATLGRAVLRRNTQDNRETRKIARNTAKRIMGVVSAVMNEAVEQNKISANPCVGVRLKGRKDDDDDDGRVDEWLRGHEQAAIVACEDIPEWGRLLMRFAWGTGLRQGEQWHLLLSDVHFAREGRCQCGASPCSALLEHGPHVFVRYGSSKAGKAKSPKAKKTRRTPLFGEGLAAIARWLEVLPSYAPKNPLGLVFPGPWGSRRYPGSPTRATWHPEEKGNKKRKEFLLPLWLKAAGVVRHVRWHDLRHTCASSLVSGTWGRKWSLDEVCKMLGHSTIKVTERYAHLCDNALRDAAEATGYAKPTGGGTGAGGVAAIVNEYEHLHGASDERRLTGINGQSVSEKFRMVAGEIHPSVTPGMSAENARRVLELISASRGAEALAFVTTLAAGALVPYVQSEKGKTG